MAANYPLLENLEEALQQQQEVREAEKPGRGRPLNQQTGFPCPVTLARPSVTPPAGAVRNAGRRVLRLASNLIINR